jgi:hypothetical protein
MGTTAHVLMITFRVWLLEIPVAAFNAFVLMDRVYKPRAGPLRAHQIAMGPGSPVCALPVAAAVQVFISNYSKRYAIVDSDLTRLDAPRPPKPKKHSRWSRKHHPQAAGPEAPPPGRDGGCLRSERHG